MRTNARRGAHALTMVVLTAAVGLSGRVEAQQTGLFPLAPIRRQRVPCDQEDPTYKIYKSQYFGYHPTCWNPFPAGWGCPSTQAPNREQSLRETPMFIDREAGDRGMMDDEERALPPPRRNRGGPQLPQGNEDVFDMPNGAPGAIPGAPPLPQNPRQRTPAPGEGANPFDELNPRGANPRGAMRTPSRSRSRARIAPTSPDDAAPELSAPARQPAEGSADRGSDADENVGPLLGLADSDIVRSDTTSIDTPPADTAADAATDTISTAPAPAAPPRRRFFGNLFSGLGLNGTRR